MKKHRRSGLTGLRRAVIVVVSETPQPETDGVKRMRLSILHIGNRRNKITLATKEEFKARTSATQRRDSVQTASVTVWVTEAVFLFSTIYCRIRP
jgi:hypothetical protein